MSTLDKRNHVEVSIRDKFKSLMKPSNFIKLVLVQQHELEGIQQRQRIDKSPEVVQYIEQLYQHYIVEAKGKMFDRPTPIIN